jgi:hypothetical protein
VSTTPAHIASRCACCQECGDADRSKGFQYQAIEDPLRQQLSIRLEKILKFGPSATFEICG